jgi:hypothetical protein
MTLLPDASVITWAFAAVAVVVLLAFVPAVAGRVAAALIAACVALSTVLLNDPGLALFFGVAAIAAHYWPRTSEKPGTLALLSEAAILAAGLGAYLFARTLMNPSYADAADNARAVIGLEQDFRLWIEPAVQDAVGTSGPLTTFFNVVYLNGYFGFVAGSLFLLWATDRQNYTLLRGSLAASALIALLIMATFPLAPPRFMPELGIIDTLTNGGMERSNTNPYAAMPSLHVGWPVLCGFILGRSIGGRTGLALMIIPGALMTFTVMATGNHYWLDAVFGAVVCLVPASLLLAIRSRRETVEEPAPAPVPRRAS